MNKPPQLPRPRQMLSVTIAHLPRFLRVTSSKSKAQKHPQEASLTMKTRRLSSFLAKGSASSPETNLTQRIVKKKKATVQDMTPRMRRTTLLKQAN